jgi:hypothetical protein
VNWSEIAKEIQSGEWKSRRFRRIDENISLPEVEIKADKVSNNSSLKKFALGAAIVLAIGYFVFKD